MNLKLLLAPSGEPVNITEVKEHIRGFAGSGEDSYLSALITSSRLEVESFLNRALITQTWDLFTDRIPKTGIFEIPMPPLVSVSNITLFDIQDSGTVFASSNYLVDINSNPGRIALNDGHVWPTTTLRPINGFKVQFIAGYGEKASVPEVIRQAMFLIIAHNYKNRDSQEMSEEAIRILKPYKVFTL